MAKTRGFKRKQAGSFTGSFYDPTAQYGRTKNKPYVNTQKGRFDAQANKEDYYQWLLGEQGAMSGASPLAARGDNPFNQFLQGDYYNSLIGGYNGARMQSGGRLEFKDYLKSVGWGSNQPGDQLTQASPGAYGAPNPFTTTSAPPAQPSGVDHARRAFFSLMPQERGANRPATGFRPGRWSVF